MSVIADACPLCSLLADARLIASREQRVSDWVSLGRQVVAMVDELEEAHGIDFGVAGADD